MYVCVCVIDSLSASLSLSDSLCLPLLQLHTHMQPGDPEHSLVAQAVAEVASMALYNNDAIRDMELRLEQNAVMMQVRSEKGRSLTHLLTHLLSHSLTHSLTYSSLSSAGDAEPHQRAG